MNKSVALHAAAMTLLLLLCGCHGGSSSSGPEPFDPNRPLGPGTYRAVLSTDAQSGVNPLPVQGVALTVALPTGVSIATADGGSGPIPDALLATALAGTSLVSGTYSAELHQVKLALSSPQSRTWSGEYLRLTFKVAAGSSVTEADFQRLNAPFPAAKVVALDPATHSTVVLTSDFKSTLKVSQ